MIISLNNQKGGVGKTTNCIHLGARLAALGYKVLLIDLDPQKDLSHGTGVRSYSYDVVDFLNGKDNFKIKQRADNFFILPGSQEFYAATFQRTALRDALKPLKQHFDYIILDAPPSNINPYAVTEAELALVASDYFLIPLIPEEYAVKNADPFLAKIFKLQKHNPKLKFLGFFFSNVLVTKNSSKKYSELIKKDAVDLLFETFIRTDSKVSDAVQLGKTIFQYAANSRAAIDYCDFTDEFLLKINNYEQNQ